MQTYDQDLMVQIRELNTKEDSPSYPSPQRMDGIRRHLQEAGKTKFFTWDVGITRRIHLPGCHDPSFWRKLLEFLAQDISETIPFSDRHLILGVFLIETYGLLLGDHLKGRVEIRGAEESKVRRLLTLIHPILTEYIKSIPARIYREDFATQLPMKRSGLQYLMDQLLDEPEAEYIRSMPELRELDGILEKERGLRSGIHPPPCLAPSHWWWYTT